MREILPVMVATAGHVDHGKTALVAALTGCDTDRLPEEKKRGLSVDLGFALCPLDSQCGLGIIDLPGHIDYISNMVAGAALAKIVLLTVAADESVMPQTLEHMEIIAQLTDARVILVITKTDKIEKKYIPVIESEVRAVLKKNSIIPDEVCCTSVKTLEGIQELRRNIFRLAASCQYEEDLRGFRLFTERSFLLRGYGRVITGIGISGVVRVGDVLTVNGCRVRVRGIESHRRKLTSAGSGVCLALNIIETDSKSDIDKIKRGWSVTAAECYRRSNSLIVRVNCINDAYRFSKVTSCRIYSATFSCNASVKLFQLKTLEKGQSCFAHVRLSEKAALAAGDRFMLRIALPLGNIGSGRVLSVNGDYRLRQADYFRKVLFDEAYKSLQQNRLFLAELFAGRFIIIKAGDLAELSHMSYEAALEAVDMYVQHGKLVLLSDRIWVVTLKLYVLAERFIKIIRQYHIDNPFSAGMSWRLLADIFSVDIIAAKTLVEKFDKFCELSIGDEAVALQSFKPVFAGRQLVFHDRILAIIDHDEKDWIACGELCDETAVERKEAGKVIDYLVNTEKIVLLAKGKFVIAKNEFYRLQTILEKAFMENDILDIATWRRLSGLSRNHGVAALEYFDQLNITRRVDGGRKKVDNL